MEIYSSVKLVALLALLIAVTTCNAVSVLIEQEGKTLLLNEDQAGQLSVNHVSKVETAQTYPGGAFTPSLDEAATRSYIEITLRTNPDDISYIDNGSTEENIDQQEQSQNGEIISHYQKAENKSRTTTRKPPLSTTPIIDSTTNSTSNITTTAASEDKKPGSSSLLWIVIISLIVVTLVVVIPIVIYMMVAKRSIEVSTVQVVAGRGALKGPSLVTSTSQTPITTTTASNFMSENRSTRLPLLKSPAPMSEAFGVGNPSSSAFHQPARTINRAGASYRSFSASRRPYR